MDLAIMRAGDPAPLLETWLGLDRRARLIVTDELGLQWSNAAGRSLLERRDPLMLCGETVRPRNPAENPRFQGFVRTASSNMSVLCLPDRHRENHMLAGAVRLPNGLIGLTACFAGEALEPHWADLREAFGLTASERDVVQALTSGLTAEAVGQKLGTSVKTVRTHIRHVYSKLGVSSREELFHKLTPYMMLD